MGKSIVDIIELDNGDEIAITIEWSPEPEQIERIMLEAADNFDDWSMPLEAARELMINSTKEHFATETDPFGIPWIPLSEKYRDTKQKMGAPDDILVLSGDLKDAATSEANWIMTHNSIFFNTGALPAYAPVHQAGTASTGSSKAIAASRGVGEPLSLKEATRIYKEHTDGSGNNTPKRAFLGIDYAAFDAIQKIFIDFMDETVTDYIEWVAPVPGDRVTTTAGAIGSLTNIRAFGGGFMVRGQGGRFLKGTFHLP